jgi:hypothetical protein
VPCCCISDYLLCCNALSLPSLDGLRTMAALQGCDEPAAADPERYRAGSVYSAGQQRSDSSTRTRGRSSNVPAGRCTADAGISAPAALRATAAKMGFDLVRINKMHHSPIELPSPENVSHRPQEERLQVSDWQAQHAWPQQAAEWPSANARWSPAQCIFRSSKTEQNAHAQHLHQGHSHAAHGHHAQTFHDSSTQIRPYNDTDADLSHEMTVSGMVRIAETPASNLHDASQHSNERQGARISGFGTDRNSKHRYAESDGGDSVHVGSGYSAGDCKLLDDAAELTTRMQLCSLDGEAGVLTIVLYPPLNLESPAQGHSAGRVRCY